MFALPSQNPFLIYLLHFLLNLQHLLLAVPLVDLGHRVHEMKTAGGAAPPLTEVPARKVSLADVSVHGVTLLTPHIALYECTVGEDIVACDNIYNRRPKG